MGQSSLPEAPTVVIRLGREKVFFWMLYLKTRLVRLIWSMWIWAKESRNFCGYFCIGSIYYTTSGIKLGGGCVTLHHPLNPPVLSWNHHKTGRIIWPQNRLRWGKREWAHSLLDEVGVLRGQRYNPSENVPQASPPPAMRHRKAPWVEQEVFRFLNLFRGVTHRVEHWHYLFFYLQTKARISISVPWNKRLRLARAIVIIPKYY